MSKTKVDPHVQAFEKALKVVYKSDWKKGKELLEPLAAQDELSDVADRARQLISVCERRLQTIEKKDLDPFAEAVFLKNQGDLEEALKLSSAKGNANDERFVFLTASIHSLLGDLDQAATSLGKAIELNPANRIHAFHDSDFEQLRADQEYHHLFEVS